MILPETTLNNSVTAVTYYKNLPFYADIWFYVMCIAMISVITYGIVIYIVNRQRNRLVVRIKNPDRTLSTYVYHKFSGTEFSIPTKEKTDEGKFKPFIYKFNKNKLYTGEWGRYIDFQYMNPEADDPVKDDFKENLPDLIKLLVSLSETTILTNLLLSSKFKDFVIIMLWIILIMLVINIANTYIAPQLLQYKAICRLSADNETLRIINSALRMKP